MTKMLQQVRIQKLANVFLIVSIYLFAYRATIGAIFALFSCALRLSKGKIRRIKRAKVLKYWIWFIVIFVLILYPIRTLNFEFYVYVSYLLSVLITITLDDSDIEYIIKCLYRVSVLILFSVFLQYIFPEGYKVIARVVLTSSLYDRSIMRQDLGYITGLTREVGYTSLFLVIGTLYLLFKDNNRNRYIKLTFFGLGLLMTGKKSQSVFFICALAFVYLLQSKNIVRYLKAIAGGVAGIFLSIVSFPVWSKFVFLSRIVTFINGLNNSMDINGLSSGRLVIYERAFQLWQSSPIWGIGWENFRNLGAYGDSVYTTWFRYFDVHNCYLQILCETGIIGAIVFCIILLVTLVTSVRSLRVDKSGSARYSMTYIIFFLLLCITEPVLYTDVYFIFFIICMIIIYSNKHKVKIRA